MVQDEPSLGTVAGQGAAGGAEHPHLGGGAMHSPPSHSEQMQMVLPYVQTSLLFEHIAPVAGCEPGQLGGVMQTLPGAAH
jgi:hypothetical protein